MTLELAILDPLAAVRCSPLGAVFVQLPSYRINEVLVLPRTEYMPTIPRVVVVCINAVLDLRTRNSNAAAGMRKKLNPTHIIPREIHWRRSPPSKFTRPR